MAMKLIKKTADYSIYARGDSRYAVKDGNKQPVNGEEKVKILLAEGLITVTEPSAPAEPEAEAETTAEAESTEEAGTEGDAEEAEASEGDEATAQ